MPHYDYRCESCGNVFEVFHKITETPKVNCPECGADSQKMVGGGAGIIFKGSGFYKTDYASSKPKEESKCSTCSVNNK